MRRAGAASAGRPVAALPLSAAIVERWRACRDRLLADPAFQRAAARFPLTRPIARRRASQLFDLVAGFVYSQVLLACVRLGLFELLADGPLAAEVIARRIALPDEATRRLLAAAVALRLVERRPSAQRGEPREPLYGLGALGAPMVGNQAVKAMIEHHGALYADLADPVALLRGDLGSNAALAGYWPYAGSAAPGNLPADRVQPYSALMSASQPLVAEEILDAVPLGRYRTLLDVGGGEGGFLISAAARAPHLKLWLFDLPAVAERARERFALNGLASRAQVHGGDFFCDPLPSGADLITLIRVVHDHDDARIERLLRAVHAALSPGGRLLLAEPMAETPGAEAMGDAYFGFYLLAMGRGRPRSAGELRGLLERAGFVRVRLLPTRLPLQVRLLRADRE